MLVMEARHVAVAVNYRHVSSDETDVWHAWVRALRALGWTAKHVPVHFGDSRSADKHLAATRHPIGVFGENRSSGFCVPSGPRGAVSIKNGLDCRGVGSLTRRFPPGARAAELAAVATNLSKSQAAVRRLIVSPSSGGGSHDASSDRILASQHPGAGA